MKKHPLVRPTAHYKSGPPVYLEKDGALEKPEGRRRKSFGTKHVSACMPFIADLRDGTTYAAWPVWSGSTTKDTRFVPMPKKAVIRIYHKAVEWNRRGKLSRCHGGLIGSHVLLVLHTLIFDFLNHATGRLDPSYSAIQRRTRLCRQTVAKALARLKQLGIINWIRRCREDQDVDGRFMLRQETNAYAILPADAMARLYGCPYAGTTPPGNMGSLPAPALSCRTGMHSHTGGRQHGGNRRTA